MKLYAIKWQGEEIKEGDWFKSLGCAISAITHFDGRVVEAVWQRSEFSYGNRYFTYHQDTTHAGKTGLALKLWWAEQQEAPGEAA